jgi:large subunit ribosomal protein L9
VLWTEGGEKQVAQIKAAREARALASVEEAVALKDRLQANPIRVQVKAGVGGRLFGAVKTADVAAAVAAAGLGEIDKRKVAFFAPIRSTGNYEATVKLHSDIVATLKLQVVAKK